MLFIVMKLSLLVYNIVGWGGEGEGERGLPIPAMQLGIVPRPCQRIFVLSDPGVPRTFVVDCRSAWTPKSCVLLSGGFTVLHLI